MIIQKFCVIMDILYIILYYIYPCHSITARRLKQLRQSFTLNSGGFEFELKLCQGNERLRV